LDKNTWGYLANGPHVFRYSFVWGDHRIIFREAQLAYIISDEANPTNHHTFSLDIDLGSSFLQLIDAPEPPLKLRKKSVMFYEDPHLTTSVWKIFVDEASSKDVVGAGVVFVSPSREAISLSYKLEFEATNNVAEYEALVLGLRVAKDMGIKEISMFGDTELIVNQIINLYQSRHPKLRTYRKEVWDLIDNFFLAFNISFIPREENTITDSLASSPIHFRIPPQPKLRYDVKVRYRPFVPNNIKYWKVFEQDQVSAIEAYGSFRTFSAVGLGLYWGDSPSFKWSEQMDLNFKNLFHQMHRIYPHKECLSQSNHWFS
jgi:ribonuclease HI